MRIFLDDIREPLKFNTCGEPQIYDAICHTYEEIIPHIESGKVTFISFDHDLGRPKSGYDVAKIIEKLAAENKIPPINYAIHSGNPVGAGNIDKAMKNAHKFWNKG